MGSTMGFSAMEATISSVTIPGAETPINMSAPLNASASDPLLCSLFVISAISLCAGFSFSSPSQIMPRLLHIITFLIP